MSLMRLNKKRSFVGATGGRPSCQLAEIGVRIDKGDRRSPLRKIFLTAFLFVLCLGLSACAPPPAPTTSIPTVVTPPLNRSVWLASLQTWQSDGSFSIRNQSEAWSGSFEWKQTSKEYYQIHFYGPFGVGNTYLLGNPERVVWKDNEGETVASTPDEMVWLKTGFLFPVSYLYDWMLGRPAPGPGTAENQQLDAKGRMSSFNQAGWDVYYLAYQSVGQGDLPTIIRLNHEDIQLKLVIRQWEIGK